MKIVCQLFLVVFILYGVNSCNTTEPPLQGKKGSLTISLADTSCTEAWINLKLQNISTPAQISFLLNDSVLTNINLTSSDTVIYFDSLLPNKNYQLQAQYSNSNGAISSNKISIQTLDTTSHNFAWQEFTFGDPSAGSSGLSDCAVISANDIWCVREINVVDTSANGNVMYNAIHWDGNEWKMKRIKTNACGGVLYPPIQAIFAFSSNDILFAHIDGSISHYNGIEFTNDCSLITQINGSANRIWGNSSNDFYVVSGKGFIAHDVNGQWSKIVSGTSLNINGIWGYHNNNTNEKDILAVGGNILTGTERIILQITNNNQVNPISPDGIENYPLTGVWFKSKWKKYVVGPGLYTENYGDITWKKIPSSTNYYVYSISETGLNDIMVCGGVGYVGHFNGTGWINYIGKGLQEINGNYYSVSIIGNTVCAVGASADGYAIALIGTR